MPQSRPHARAYVVYYRLSRRSVFRQEETRFFLKGGTEPMARSRIPLCQAEERSRLQQERLDMSTAETGLSVRTTNCLGDRGSFTVRDLLNCRPEDLLSISNFGEKTLEEVYKALEDMGFCREREPASA